MASTTEDGHPIRLEEYPKEIHKAWDRVLSLKRKADELRDERETREALLKTAHWKECADTDKLREAAFKLVLKGDVEWDDLNFKTTSQDWEVKAAEKEAEKLQHEFYVARLKFRATVVQAEIFAGIPIEDAQDDPFGFSG